VRRIQFKKRLRDTMKASAAYMAAMTPGGMPADLQEALDRSMPAEAKKRAAPRQLEAPVVAAISELLAVHPRVLFAVRQNSGMASYEAKSGNYAPVYFYRLLRHGKDVTITDFWGILRDGRMLAIEAKAPGWSKPRNDRELAQANFLALIRNIGGVALFATSADQVAEALK